MRLLDRYLLRELLIPLAFILGGLILLIDTFELCNQLHDFQEKKLWVSDVAEYYLVKAPETLVFLAPIVLLLALLYALTHHSRHNEITAIRAAGISLWRLSLPYFGVGFACCLAYFALNELWVPSIADRTDGILNRRVADADARQITDFKKRDFASARNKRLWHWEAFPAATMTSPVIQWTLPDGSRTILTAKRADWTNGVWTFYDAHETTTDPTPAHPKTNDVTHAEPYQPGFSETPREMKSWLRIKYRPIASTAKSVEFPIADILDYIRLTPKGELSKDDRASLYTQLNGRLAAPWTCLVVVLIALPFGAAPGRRNVFVGVASSITIFFVYYILLKVCLALGTGGYIPPWLAGWFPNAAFAGVGLYLTFRVQ